MNNLKEKKKMIDLHIGNFNFKIVIRKILD